MDKIILLFMKFSLYLCTAILCVVISTQCTTQERLTENNWQMLFNGEDLSGWEMLNGQHEVYVEDGVIVGTTVPGEPNGFLCTTEHYDDFILELEVNADLLLDNSGIQFRSNSNEDYRNYRVHGYQAQTENRPPHVSQWNGAIYDEARRGWLYIVEDDPVRQKAYVHNQWNRFRIEAIGTANRVWVNGIAIAHLVDDETLSGFICLQFHGGGLAEERGRQSIYMRDVRIQTDNLRPTPYDEIPVVNLIPNTISGQEAHQGFELLFDGETISNWRGITRPGLPESNLDIEDGALRVFSSEGAWSGDGKAIMMTEAQYGPFELKFDFRLHDEDAVVGVEYFFDGDVEKEREAVYGQLALYNARRLADRNRSLWRDWNRAVIKASPDGRVEYWLNDYKILEYHRDSDAPARGHILLDSYGDSISYRSIKIREL
jgi:hypothetical protein